MEKSKFLFSKIELDYISDVLGKNYSLLTADENYSRQEKEINELYDKLCNCESKELKDKFYKYDSLIIDNQRYENLIAFYVGLRIGIAIEHIKGWDNHFKELKEQYSTKKIVDFTKYFDNEDFNLFKSFGINIENRLYTEEEFFLIKMDILANLPIRNISKKDSKKILKNLRKICNDYNF